MRVLRQAWAGVRGRLEGVDYLAHGRPGRPGVYAQSRMRQGLRAMREAWWIQARLERYGTIRHYAFLLDWALAEPGYRATAEVLPVGGRLVVFRFGHLGDILHLLPSLREIKRQRPDVRMELVTGPWNKALLADQDVRFDAVHYFTPDVIQYHRGQSDGVRAFAGEQAFIRTLRGNGVDLVFCPAKPHFAELCIIIGLQPSHYVGGDWNLQNLPTEFPCHTRPFDSRHYEMEAIADFLPDMGLERKPVSLAYQISSSCLAAVDERLKKENQAGKPVLSVFPGSGWSGKCWPVEHFVALLNRVNDDGRFMVVLGGSPGERWLCEHINSQLKHAALITAGRLSLDESAALIQRSALLIGNDSAPIHVAAAVGCPTVSLWGPTFPEKWAPRGAMHTQVKRRGDCAGCTYWHPAAPCTGRPSCITTIAVDDVLEAVERQLEASRSAIPG